MGKALDTLMIPIEYVIQNARDRGRTHIRRIMIAWNTRNKKQIAIWVGTLLFGITTGVLLDIYLSHALWANILRALVSGIPLIYSTATLCYLISYIIGETLTEKTEGEWVPLKERNWASFKARVAVVAATATLLCTMCIFIPEGTHLWSVINSCSLGFTLALCTFLLTTEDEQDAKSFGVRDQRTQEIDAALEEFKENVEKRNAKAKEQAERRRAARRERFFGRSKEKVEQPEEVNE